MQFWIRDITAEKSFKANDKRKKLCLSIVLKREGIVVHINFSFTQKFFHLLQAARFHAWYSIAKNDVAA